MADNSKTLMTDAGFALEARVRADETTMQFTRATISTDDHFSDADDVLAKLTELDNVQQDGDVTDVRVIDETTVHVQIDIDQTKAPKDYAMLSAGLYAKDGDGNEIMYGVIALKDPAYVHQDNDGSYLGFSVDTAVGRAENVTIVVSQANMVTKQILDAALLNYYTKAEVDAKFVTDDDFASKLPKNIATTDAANTFTKSQTLAGGATDGAGNAIATTKDVSDGDATTLKSAKDYADTKISGKADDSKVVHTADMRKPASDVAGIEEVNAKADTSAVDQLKTNLTNQVSTLQTQVDNSAVGTNLLTGTSNAQGYTMSGSGWETGSQSSNGTNVSIPCTPGASYMYSVIVKSTTYACYPEIQFFSSGKNLITNSVNIPGKDIGMRKTTAVAPENAAFVGAHTVLNSPVDSQTVVFNSEKLEKGSVATDWCPNPEDKVNVADMRKPANDVAGIEEVNAKQDKIGYTPADDSKVAHLSGANNFDTVPMVKNNPLLLASSLPSDLARTGQDTNFTGKLQKSGVDVATKSDVTTAISAATTNMPSNADVSPLIKGVQHEGADLNNETTPGSYFSNSKNTNGPSIGGFSDHMYLGWTVALVGDGSVIHQTAFKATGDLAERTFYDGSGWGPWKGMVQDNGNSTITVNGQTYTPANDTYAIKRNDAGNTVGTVKMPDGNLQSSNGLHYYPVEWFGSYDEAMAYSKTHPYIDCRW